jgi:hypothetical protein
MDINGILINESALNVNGKRSRDTSDLLETNEVQTKRIRIGTEPDTYYLPEQEGKSGQTIVADGIGGSNWEGFESAGNSILENLLLDPLTGGTNITSVPSVLTTNSWLINPPAGGVPWEILTGDYNNFPPHEWLPPSATGRCYCYFETTLPNVVNTFETNFVLKLWGDVGGRISGDETSVDNDVFCWIQKQNEAPPASDDTLAQLQAKDVYYLRKLEPRAGQPWGHAHFLTSQERYEVNIDPGQWEGQTVRIGLGFNNAGPLTMIPPAIFPPGARFTSMQLFSQFPGSGAIATLPEQIDHDVLINSGNIIDHATIDTYLNQAVTTASDVEFKSVALEGWTLGENAGGDLEMLKGENKFVFGDHVNNYPSTICAFIPNDSIGSGGFRTYRSRGTLALPTAVEGGDVLDMRRTFAHNGTKYESVGAIRTRAAGDHTVLNAGTYVEFELTAENTAGLGALGNYYQFKTDGFRVGDPISAYTLPTLRASVANQVLRSQDAAGNVGWTSLPNQSLDTSSNVTFASMRTEGQIGLSPGSVELGGSGFSFFNRSDNMPGGVGIQTTKTRGSPTVPTALLANDTLYTFVNRGHDGASYREGSAFRSATTQDWTPSAQGTSFEVDVTRSDEIGRVPYLRIDSGGMTVGDINGGVSYKLPAARGFVGQLLKLGDDGETLGWDTVGKYQQLQSGFANNTALESSLTDQNAALAKGNLIFPAGVVKTGDSIHIRVSGAFHSESKEEEVTLRIFSIDSNSVKHVLHTTGLIDLDEIKIAETPYEWEVDLVIRDAGATSTVYANSQLSYSKEFNAAGGRLWNSNSFSTTLNLLTLDNTLDISAQWDSASAQNTFRADMITVTKTF